MMTGWTDAGPPAPFARGAVAAHRAGLVCAPNIAATPASTETLPFVGRIEAAERAMLSSRRNGVVEAILFEGGERVERGPPLIRLDPADAELTLAAAEAGLAGARVRSEGADRRAARHEALAQRGVAAEAQVGPTRTERAAARAGVALAQAGPDRAALDLDRVVIRAPISGCASRPMVAAGMFLEARSGPPPAEIVALDAAVVARAAPRADRLAALEAAGADAVEELRAGLRVTLRLPGGRLCWAEAAPHAASAGVGPATGAVKVRVRCPDPDAIPRPGMAVEVVSRVGADRAP